MSLHLAKLSTIPRPRRLRGSLLLTSLLGGLGLAASLHADEPHALGLRPETKAERAWLKAHAETPKEVRFNRIAVERINAERKEKGLPPLPSAGVEMGKEVIPYGAREAKTRAEYGKAALGTKVDPPVAVDNSLLPSFPPIMNQGTIGSCASFTATYYGATHMVGMLRGTNNKAVDANGNPGPNTAIFSPKWSYTMTNGGGDNGGSAGGIYPFLQLNGCATLQDLPYNGNKTDPTSYLAWSIDPAVYRRALSYRMGDAGTIRLVNDDGTLNTDSLTKLKGLLANGYVFYFGTNVHNWTYANIQKDPASARDTSGYVGKPGCIYTQVIAGRGPSGHAMTIVGYNDDVWLDLNGNNVVDPGEKGALRICNSWGTNWAPDGKQPDNKDGGLTWLSYDALLPTSAVAGAPTVPGREPVLRKLTAVINYLTARASYTPKLIGQFTLNAAKREELNAAVGISPTTATAPTATAKTGAVTTTADFVFDANGQSIPGPDGNPIGKGRGGKFNFLGQATPTGANDGGGEPILTPNETALDGGFAFDLTDVATDTSTLQRYYLSLGDNKTGHPSQALSFVLTDAAGNLLTQPGQAVNAPANADNSTALVYVDYGATAAPQPVVSGAGTTTGQGVSKKALSTSATAGTPFTYQITAANDPTSYGATSLPPGLTLDPATGVISGIPATAGIYNISISANNAGGTGSADLVLVVNAPAGVTPPVFGSPAIAAGTLGQPFSYQATAAPATQAYALEGTIPTGLAFDPATGLLSGTPIEPGTFTLTLEATNAAGRSTRLLTLTVASAAATPGLPVFTSSSLVEAVADDLINYRSVATNRPTSYAAFDLPEGLSINATTGVISGRVPQARSYTVIVAATNAVGTGYLTLLIEATGDDAEGPKNNDLANATNLRSANPAITGGTNIRATAEVGEPAHGGQDAVQSVWYEWTSPSTGAATFDTTGSDFQTIVEVYTGSDYTDLKSVGASNGDASLPAGIVTIQATAGTTYRVAVDSNPLDRGNLALKISAPTDAAAQAKPVNDNFANRIALANTPQASVEGENLNATAEAGEPVPPDQDAPGNTVWYTYTPATTGQLTVDTDGSDFDTVVSAYTGSAVNALTLLGSNDQIEDGDDNTSRLTVPVTQGVPVQIAVSGYEGDQGAITLNVNLATADAITLKLAVTRQTVTSSGGLPGIITITRTAGDQTQPVLVEYKVIGTADAADFAPLKGVALLKPGKTTKQIKIKPVNRGAGVTGTVSVKVKILPGANYVIDGKVGAKVLIVRDGK